MVSVLGLLLRLLVWPVLQRLWLGWLLLFCDFWYVLFCFLFRLLFLMIC